MGQSSKGHLGKKTLRRCGKVFFVVRLKLFFNIALSVLNLGFPGIFGTELQPIFREKLQSDIMDFSSLKIYAWFFKRLGSYFMSFFCTSQYLRVFYLDFW